jgi:hypothetical protein
MHTLCLYPIGLSRAASQAEIHLPQSAGSLANPDE